MDFFDVPAAQWFDSKDEEWVQMNTALNSSNRNFR